MLRGIDPYTEYYPEKDMNDLKMMTTGKYAGIGAVIRQYTGRDYIYIALEENGTFYKGVKIGERYGTDDHQGYYYKHAWADDGDFIIVEGENVFTEVNSLSISGISTLPRRKTIFPSRCKALRARLTSRRLSLSSLAKQFIKI